MFLISRITTPEDRIKIKSFQSNAITLTVLNDQSDVSTQFEARVVSTTVGGGRYEADLYVKKVFDYERDPHIHSLVVRATESSTGLTSSVSVGP